MSEPQRQAARARFERESQVVCPSCQGSGRVLADAVTARARKGGNATFLASLQPGGISMSQRGQRGGRPPEPSIGDLVGRDRGTVACEAHGGLAPESADPRAPVPAH